MVPGASSIMMRGGAAALSSRDDPLSALNSNPLHVNFHYEKTVAHGGQAALECKSAAGENGIDGGDADALERVAFGE